MNPINDPADSITPAELAAIVRASRPDRPRNNPPKAATGFSLSIGGRLWYVAEFIHQARLAKRAGKTEIAELWRERAQEIAESVARLVCHAPPDEQGKEVAPELLRAVADALDGKHQPETGQTDQQRVLTAVNDFCADHPGKLPSRRNMIKMEVRGETVTEVFANLEKQGSIRFPKEKRGPKPKN